MKRSLILVVFIFICINVFPQSKGPKISAKHLNQIGKNAMAIQKINESLTSFEEVSASLKSQLGDLNFAGLKDSLDLQARYMDTIFQILEASNLRISVTADSLSTTTYTIVSLIDDTNDKFDDINSSAEQNFLYTLAGLALIALLGLILFVILFIKMGRQNKKSKAQFAEMKAKVDEELGGMIKSVEDELSNTKNSLEGRIRITDNALNRRLTEKSEAFEKQFSDTKSSVDEQFKTSADNYQKQINETQDIFKKEIGGLQKLLDEKLADTNEAIDKHISSTKEILDKLTSEKD